MANRTGEGQSGGVNIGGTIGSVGGDIVGRDKIVGAPSAARYDHAGLRGGGFGTRALVQLLYH